MGFLNIGKIRGVLLSALVVMFYYYWWLPHWHYELFGFYPVYGPGYNFIIAGLVMTQVVIIQPGDRAKLTFLGSEINRTWGDGIAFLPNAFHSTIVLFKFAILWGLAVLKNDTYRRYEEPPVNVDVSDSNFKYQANVQMTFFGAQVSRGLGVILKLFCDFKRVPQEYYLASFGYRVLLVGIIMVCFNSTTILAQNKLAEMGVTVPTVNQPGTAPIPRGATGEPKRNEQPETVRTQPSQQQQSVTQENRTQTLPQPSAPPPEHPSVFIRFNDQLKGSIPFHQNGITYNLIEDQFVRYFPNKQWLQQEQFGLLGKMPDDVTHYSAGKGNVRDKHANFMPYMRKICLVVHRGERASIVSQRPPSFVVNMGPKVWIGHTPGDPTHRERRETDAAGQHWATEGTWKYLYDGWHANMNSFGTWRSDMQGNRVHERDLFFHVMGPSKDEPLLQGLEVGLVCFY